jgi:ERCC4-type nuclease
MVSLVSSLAWLRTVPPQKACNVKVEKRQLPAGDACWIAKSKLNPGEEYVLDALLERKSVSDLEGSIKVGCLISRSFIEHFLLTREWDQFNS